MHTLLTLLTLPLLLPPSLSANICYAPNGDTNKDVPCDPNAPVTQCCSTRAACLTNGLCALAATNDTGISYARGTCTDRSWSSPLCPQQCQLNQDTPTNASAYDFRSGGVQVWQCGSQGYAREGQYCCESEAEKTRCCSTKTAVFTLGAAVVGASTAVVSASTSGVRSEVAGSTRGASTTVETGAASSSTAKGGGGSGGRNTKAIGIGAGVGGAVGLVVIAGVVFFCVRRRKGGKEGKGGGNEYHEHHVAEVESKSRHELPNTPLQPIELPQPQPVWELPGDKPGGIPRHPHK